MSTFKSAIENYIESPFPLNANLFNDFISIKQYSLCAKTKEGGKDKPITDGDAIFLLVITKLQKSGVQFSRPGNSPKRNFITWFNSHFVTNQPYSHSIEIKENHFDLAYAMVLNLYKESSLVKNTKNKISYFEICEIDDIHSLTIKGKIFIRDVFQQPFH